MPPSPADLYDFSSPIVYEFSVGEQPVVPVVIANPHNQKQIPRQNAVVDSGADISTAPGYFNSIWLGHNLQQHKPGMEVISLSGVSGSDHALSAYPHSSIATIYNGSSPVDFIKPLALDLHFIVDDNRNSPDCPILLGRKDFFTYFYITFHNTASTSVMTFFPRKDIVK